MALLNRLRAQVQECMAKYLFSSAAFLADKVATISGGQGCDILVLAQAHYCNGNYRRALHLVRRELEKMDAWPRAGEEISWTPQQHQLRVLEDASARRQFASPAAGRVGIEEATVRRSGCREGKEAVGLALGARASRSQRQGENTAEIVLGRGSSKDANGRNRTEWKPHVEWLRYLAAKCLEKLQEWELCLLLLGNLPSPAAGAADGEDGGKGGSSVPSHPATLTAATPATGQIQKGELASALSLLRGRVFEALGNRPQAVLWYTAALQADPFCFEAFQQMVDNHMLTVQEEVELVASLRLEPGDEWLRQLYSCQIKMYGREEAVEAVLSELESRPERSLCMEGSPEGDPMFGDRGTGEHGTCTNPVPARGKGNRSEAKAAAEGSLLQQQQQQVGAGEPRGRKPGSRGRAGANSGKVPAAGGGGRGGTAAPGMGGRVREVGVVADEAAMVERGVDEVEMAAAAAGAGEPWGTSPRVSLGENADVAACRAAWLFHTSDYSAAYDVTKRILQEDPFHLGCIPTHLAAALQLGRKNDLFLHAHRLAQECPKSALAWFAVACYYMSTRQFDQARRYFSKATAAGPTFAPAWLGFGHAYAAQDETDQAMVAYRTAARIFSGCHLPLLCIGLEYQRSNNLPLAQHFLEDACRVCPSDPLVHNELGVVAYLNRNYPEAQQHFERALSLSKEPTAVCCEPILVNLGHTYRKQRLFRDALSTYECALSILPRTASTFSAIGFTHHLLGDVHAAVEWYHKALGLRPDDSLATEMLTIAVTEDSRSPLGVAMLVE